MASPWSRKRRCVQKYATPADESHCKEQLSTALPFERTPVHGPLPLVDTPPMAAEPPFNECLQHNGKSLVSYKRDMFPTHDSATSKDGRFTEGASGQAQTPDAAFRITL